MGIQRARVRGDGPASRAVREEDDRHARADRGPEQLYLPVRDDSMRRSVGAAPLLVARSLLALQRSHGNAAVQRLIQRSPTPPATVQREDETPGMAGVSAKNFSLLGDDEGLQLDESIEAEMRAAQFTREILNPSALRPNLFEISLDDAPSPDLLEGPAAPKSKPLVPAGRGPAKPRAAKSGDVLKAVLALPAVDEAVTNLREEALDKISRDVRSLTPGEAAAAVSAVVVVGGGAVAAVAADPEARAAALSQLDGRVLPVPGVGGLGLELNTKGDNFMVGFHLDLGRFLPESMGFGPSSPKPLGAPPSRRR